jgi:predicted ABC-type ATPase
MHIKRLRLFAGPNGSGKTTILERIPKELNLGYIVNADDIEIKLKADNHFPLDSQNIYTNSASLQNYFRNEGFSVHKIENHDFIEHINVIDNNINIPADIVNSYIAADIAGFLRIKHIENNHTFTFESVLSHPSKLDLLIKAKSVGYRIYLYYIATESADINVNRVKIRVSQLGHPVPEEAIRNRYIKSLNLLYDVIKISDRAYIFDNSGKESIYLAEITNGENATLHCSKEEVPEWFYTYVINRTSTNMP